MSTWKINLKEQTATSINGITFKLTESKPGALHAYSSSLSPSI